MRMALTTARIIRFDIHSLRILLLNWHCVESLSLLIILSDSCWLLVVLHRSLLRQLIAITHRISICIELIWILLLTLISWNIELLCMILLLLMVVLSKINGKGEKSRKTNPYPVI